MAESVRWWKSGGNDAISDDVWAVEMQIIKLHNRDTTHKELESVKSSVRIWLLMECTVVPNNKTQVTLTGRGG